LAAKDFEPKQLPDDAVWIWASSAEYNRQTNLAKKLWQHISETRESLVCKHKWDIVSHFLNLNDYEDALVELQKLQPLYGADDCYWQLRTRALLGLERFTEAEQAISDGLAKFPKCFQLYAQRASLRFHQRREAEFASDLDKALELYPPNKGLLITRIHFEKGGSQFQHVLSDFDQVIALSSGSEKEQYLIEKAVYLNDMGDLQNAVATLNLCLGQCPASEKARTLLHRYCAELKKNKIPCAGCDLHN
jgi:tetratricopeptide (TPR) repeat protein